MAVIGLLSSWVTPPTSCPIEASFSDSVICACKRFRLARDSREWVNRRSNSQSSKRCRTKTMTPMRSAAPRVRTRRNERIAQGKCRIQQRPGGKKWERKSRDHSQPGQPYAMRRGSGGNAGLRFALAGRQTDDCDPCHGNGERNVVETSAVINLPAMRPIGDIRTGGVGEAGAEQAGVKDSPAIFAVIQARTKPPRNAIFSMRYKELRFLS